MNEHKEYDVDLIDLLGILIRYRRFILVFSIVCAAIAWVSVLVKERSAPRDHLIHLRVDHALSAKRDVAYTIFSAARPNQPISQYAAFITRLLYPSQSNDFLMEIYKLPSGSKFEGDVEDRDVAYLFYRGQDASEFTSRFDSFRKKLEELNRLRQDMDQATFTRCVYYQANLTNFSKDRVLFIFDNIDEARKCNRWAAQNSSVQSILSAALGRASGLSENVFSSIVAELLEDADDLMFTRSGDALSRLGKSGESLSFRKSVSDFERISSIFPSIGSTPVEVVSAKRALKYALGFFFFGIFFAIFLSFLLNYLNVNKNRLRDYFLT